MLVVQAALFYTASHGDSTPLASPLIAFPAGFGDWRLQQEGVVDKETQDVLRADDILTRSYVQPNGRGASLFIAYFRTQRYGQSPHSPKNCLPGSGWEIWKHDSAMVPVNGGQVEINQYSIQNSGQRMLVFYWYQSKQRIIASEYMGTDREEV